jgi:hypothetical protein
VAVNAPAPVHMGLPRACLCSQEQRHAVGVSVVRATG